MKKETKYKYVSFGFIAGFMLSLFVTGFEDYKHNINILLGLSSIHQFIMPGIIGCITGLIAYIFWKRKEKQSEAIKNYAKNLHSLYDINTALMSSIDLEKVLQIIISESTHLTNLDTGAIYLHENEKLYLGATTPPLPTEFPALLSYDLLANHPNIQKSLEKKQPVVIADTASAILSEAEMAVVKFRGLRSIIYIPLIIENRPIGTLILGTTNELRTFTVQEINLYHLFSSQAALTIENARLYKESVSMANELRQQNEEFLTLNEELSESNSRIWTINEELKFAKEKAEENEIRFKALHNASFGGITIHDKGLILECNKGLSELTGYSINELIGMDGLLLMAEHTREKVKNNITRGFEKPYEAIGVRKNGEEYPVRLEAREIPYKGKIVRVVEFRDITERKQAEAELLIRETNFITLFDTVRQAIYIQNPDLTFITVNQGAVDMYGYPREYFMGKNPGFLSAPGRNDLGHVAELIELAFKGAPQNFEFWGIKKDGTVFPKDIWSVKGTYYGKDVVITVANDITARKQNELELIKAKEKAEESDQLKTAFLENILHEVRTPMNAILGFSELLLKPNLTNEKRKQFTDVMHKATYQLLTIVDNTITLAYIETKQLKLDRIDFSTAKLISELFKEYNNKKLLLEKEHIQLIVHEPEKSDLLINNDYNRINQILKILLDNAFKFTDKGSVEFGYTLDENNINYFVKDTGIGIPPEKQEVIFKSFAQSDKTIRQLFGGLGVGLSIALGLVNMLEGKVTLNSQTNIGTEIIFSLPLTNN